MTDWKADSEKTLTRTSFKCIPVMNGGWIVMNDGPPDNYQVAIGAYSNDDDFLEAMKKGIKVQFLAPEDAA